MAINVDITYQLYLHMISPQRKALICYDKKVKILPNISSLIERLRGPTWGPSGADRTQVGPMLAPWTLLSGVSHNYFDLRHHLVLMWWHLNEYRWRPNLVTHVRINKPPHYYRDVIMRAIVSQITGVSIVCTTICSGANQRKHQRSASLVFVRGIQRWPVNSWGSS